MNRDSLREMLEENEELFQMIATADQLPPWAREKYGRRPLDELENLRMEAGGSESSTDGA